MYMHACAHKSSHKNTCVSEHAILWIHTHLIMSIDMRVFMYTCTCIPGGIQYAHVMH